MKEIWKDIKGYEGLYQISNLGRVKSLIGFGGHRYIKREKILKAWKCKTHDNGDYYLYITLSKNKVHTKKSVHRLVAENFIENYNNLPEVNHKDGNKQNNCVFNLEWCTYKENQNHSWTILKRKSNKEKAKVSDELIKLFANGDWNKVECILNELSEKYDVDIVVYKL
nr:MAG TPA: homing endonuclease [Caudoviricetes sp.]